MGQNKAFIRLDGESLLRRLARVGEGFGEQLVSTDHILMAKETGFRMVPDIKKAVDLLALSIPCLLA